MSFASRQGLPGARLRTALVLAVMALGIAGCSTTPSAPPEPPPPPVIPTLPPAFPSQAIVGNWGLAAYHREEDRVRTENNAAGQCRQPYVIGLGPTGGVMMHLADQQQPSELVTKGGTDGRRYLGPAGPAGDALDREIVNFDGRVMELRWVDKEVAGRYGTSIFVRCAPRVAAPRR